MEYLTREVFDDIEPVMLSRYWQYLDANYEQIPEGIHALATRRDYYKRTNERSPLDRQLVSIRDVQDGIVVTLSERGKAGRLAYHYIDVVEEFTPDLTGVSEPRWLVDEFRYEDDGGIIHEIVWYTGRRKEVNWLFKAFGFELKFVPDDADEIG